MSHRSLVLSLSLLLSLNLGCADDVVSPKLWGIEDISGADQGAPIASSSADMSLPAKDDCLMGILPSTAGFELESKAWRRTFEPLITPRAVYQLSLILEETEQQWTASIAQRLCIRDERGGTIWSLLSPYSEVDPSVIGEGAHDLQWVYRGILELVDSSGAELSLDCLRGLEDGDGEEPAWIKSGVMLKGMTWHELPNVDRTQHLAPRHDLRHWNDQPYGDPAPSHTRYKPLNYMDNLSINIYWPKVHELGLRLPDEAHAQRDALCAKNGLPRWYGAPPTKIDQAFYLQSLGTVDLPERARRYLRAPTNTAN